MSFGTTSLGDFIFGANTISQVRNTDVQAQLTEIVGRYSGGLDPQQRSILSMQPRVAIQTQDLSGVLTATSVTIGSFVEASTVSIPWAKRSLGGAFAGAGANMILTSTAGMLIPTQFSAQQDSPDGAIADVEFYPIWDGSTDLIAVNTAQDLAAQAFSGLWTLGPAKLNGGSALDGLTGATVRPGIQTKIKAFGGAAFPTWCEISMRDPQMDLTFEDLDAIPSGLVAQLTSAVCYFQKIAAGGTRVAAATAAHAKFTLTGGLEIADNITARENDDGTATLSLRGLTLAATIAAIT